MPQTKVEIYSAAYGNTGIWAHLQCHNDSSLSSPQSFRTRVREMAEYSASVVCIWQSQHLDNQSPNSDGDA